MIMTARGDVLEHHRLENDMRISCTVGDSERAVKAFRAADSQIVDQPLPIEQTPAAFRDWLAKRGLTVRSAADLFGVSKDSITKYAKDGAELPRWLPLAVLGLEAIG